LNKEGIVQFNKDDIEALCQQGREDFRRGRSCPDLPEALFRAWERGYIEERMKFQQEKEDKP